MRSSPVAWACWSAGAATGTRRGRSPQARSSPEEAAVRETLDETGLRVSTTGVIGSRIHPQTGWRIVYVAAVPASEAEAQIPEALEDSAERNDRELAEVRWGQPGGSRGADG